MHARLNRLFIVSCICFFPLAIMGRSKARTSVRSAVLYYQAAILVFAIFLVLLAFYTYDRGGNFVKPMGTFY